jgi:enoyl-CoA hydratase/carnithine racemase
MGEGLILCDLVDGVAILTLNNSQKRNALSNALLSELKAHLERIKGDPNVRVVVIRAEGPAFSSGHDLRELVNGSAGDYDSTYSLSTSVMEAIRLLPQPVIAQVQGVATASGCQLVATCDLAVASETATFATPGVQIGLFCTTPGVALARAVPTKKAMEMLLTGAPISAQEALECGLVNMVAPPEELEAQTMALARRIASFSPYVVALGKAAFYKQMEMGWAEAYRLAIKVMTDNTLASDAQEGINAFLSKRKPT